MELVNARRSRTGLTEANEGDIIAPVEQVTLRSRYLMSQSRILEVLPDSHLHQHNFGTSFKTMACARTPVIGLYAFLLIRFFLLMRLECQVL